MKLLNKSICALALASMMGLWSCTSDEALPGTTIAGKAVPLSITVSRGEAQTRTIVSENDEAGLNSVWKEGDVIVLYDSEGKEAGRLGLKEGEENKSSSVFEGTITGDSGTYNLWYFGQPDEEGKYPHIDFTTKKPRLTLPTSPMTEDGQLAEFDIMSKAAEIVVSNGKAAVKDDVTMDPRMAMAKFSFASLPGNKTGKLTISNLDNGANATLFTACNIKLTDHEMGLVANAYKDYVIEGVATDKDLYIAFFPDVDYKLGFTFEVDDKVYTHEFENSTKLVAGCYYNGGMNTEGEKVNGYVLSFTEVVDEIDHSKNPLAKWAEANLVQDSSTDGATSKSYIASSSSTKGSLYQWGRNKGWKDYVAARDYVTQLGNATYALTNFDGEVDDDGLLKTNYSTGLGHFYLNNQDYVVCPSMYGLTTVEDIVVNPEYWIMNGQTSNSTGDYWIGNEGGSTWSERATAGGFEYESPAPENWRLPTKEEFLQITPKDKTITDSQKTLKEELNNYTELREIPGTCKYVIRWKADNSGINISAIVVSDSFTEEDIDNVNWSDSNVVKRFFPYTGVIRSSVINCTPKNAPYYYLNGRNVKLQGWFSIYANMYPMGDVTNEDYCSNYDKLGNYLYGYYYSAKINVLTNHNDKVGAYWVSDSKEAFYFNTNENWSGQTTRFGVQGRTSNLHSVRPDNGYAIRCVKDN